MKRADALLLFVGVDERGGEGREGGMVTPDASNTRQWEPCVISIEGRR
jgi:hypothetical protein